MDSRGLDLWIWVDVDLIRVIWGPDTFWDGPNRGLEPKIEGSNQGLSPRVQGLRERQRGDKDRPDGTVIALWRGGL